MNLNHIQRQHKAVLISQPNNETIDKVKQLLLAIRAAKLGSRPPVIATITGLSMAKARKIFRDVTGSDPCKGQMPSDTTFYISDLNKHIESAYLVQVYKTLSIEGDNKFDDYQCQFTAYEQYLNSFPSPQISFDRFFLLIRLSCFSREIILSHCPECHCTKLSVKSWKPSRSVKCPVCHIASSN